MLSFNLNEQYQGKIEWLDNFKPQSRILYDKPLRIMKRLMDIAIIAAVLPLCVPLFLICVPEGASSKVMSSYGPL